jgi:hypothetical protein
MITRTAVSAAFLLFYTSLFADTWDQVGNSNLSVNLAVKCMVVDSTTNTLYIGGVPGVMRYNGTTWTNMTAGVTLSSIDVMALYNGALYIGGQGLGMGSNCLYKWNGTGWTAITVGMCGPVKAMVVYNNQLLVAGILYGIMGNVNTVGFAAWDGSAWNVFGGGYAGVNPGGALTMKIFSTGLYAGGPLSTLLPLGTALKKYNGSDSWVDPTGGAAANLANIWSMAEYGGGILVGGDFTGGKKLALVSGGGWSTFQGGADSTVFAVQPFHSKLYIGGCFTHVGTAAVACNYVACWDGSTWSPIGSGMGNSQPYVLCMTVYNDKLIVGGQFTRADGKLIANIAQLAEGTPVSKNIRLSVNNRSGIKVHCSPSTITISLPEFIAATGCSFTLFDVQGRALLTKHGAAPDRQLVIVEKHLAQGTFFYNLNAGGKCVESGRIIIY